MRRGQTGIRRLVTLTIDEFTKYHSKDPKEAKPVPEQNICAKVEMLVPGRSRRKQKEPFIWTDSGYTVRVKKDRGHLACLCDPQAQQICQIKFSLCPGGQEQALTIMKDVGMKVIYFKMDPFAARDEILKGLDIAVPVRVGHKRLLESAKKWSPKKKRT